jgi:hypothetical protein
MFVEHDGKRFGPYGPIDGPIPLHRYRSFKRTRTEERIDRIEALAGKLGLPRAALSGTVDLPSPAAPAQVPSVPFTDPDPFQELPLRACSPPSWRLPITWPAHWPN